MNVLDQIYAKAKQDPQRVVFPEAENEKMMQAAYETGKDGYIIPVLVGDETGLRQLCEERGYDSSVFRFVDINDGEYKKKRKVLMEQLPVPVHAEIFQRDGYKTVVFALDEE